VALRWVAAGWRFAFWGASSSIDYVLQIIQPPWVNGADDGKNAKEMRTAPRKIPRAMIGKVFAFIAHQPERRALNNSTTTELATPD
jgi:hypothetical protein